MFGFVRQALSHVPVVNRIIPPPPPPEPKREAAEAAKSEALGKDNVKLAPSGRPSDVRLSDKEWKADLGLVHLAERTRSKELEWFAGRPLSEAKNAHRTNTKDQMEEALKGDHSFLEGDLRATINPPHEPEMRHDPGHESGDNLTLREWLEIGKRSGRGLKVDVKEGTQIPKLLEECEKVGVDPGKLMFNLGEANMDQYGAEIRKRFPQAILAFNPPATPEGLAHATKQAAALGKPYTFVMKDSDLTPENIKQLEASGPVSVWNSPGGSDSEVKALEAKLRAQGVSGVIDLRPGMDLGEKIEFGLDKAQGYVNDGLEKGKDVLGGIANAGKGVLDSIF